MLWNVQETHRVFELESTFKNSYFRHFQNTVKVLPEACVTREGCSMKVGEIFLLPRRLIIQHCLFFKLLPCAPFVREVTEAEHLVAGLHLPCH